MDIVFVLVGPKTPENIGAAARALKTMGFATLRLVNPAEFRTDINGSSNGESNRGPAYKMAMHSHDILDHAGIFPSLAEAVADCALTIGSTAKLRHHRHTVLTPPQLKNALLDKKDRVARVALIFGPEDTGLTNEHLDACDLLTSIPMAAVQPSINLAQAVMIYAYILSELSAELSVLARHSTAAATAESWDTVIAQIQRAAKTLGVDADARVVAWLRERVPLLPARDLNMLFNLLKRKSGSPRRSGP